MKDFPPSEARTLAVFSHPPDPTNWESFYWWHCSHCGSNDREYSDWDTAMDAAEQHVCEL